VLHPAVSIPCLSISIWTWNETGCVRLNGYALIVTGCEPEAEDVSGLISVQAFKCAKEIYHRQKMSAAVRFVCRKNELSVEDVFRGKVYTFIRPKGDYPDWTALVSEISGPPTLSFDLADLAAIVRAMPEEELGDTEVKSISIFVPLQDEQRSKVPVVLVKATPKADWLL